MPILDAYAHMRRCAEAIENAPAFTEKTARAHAVCTRKTRQIETECTNRRAEILQKIKADTGAAITRTNAVLCTPPSAAIFAENAEHAPLSLGHAAPCTPLRQNVYSAAYLYKARLQRAVFNG